MSQIRFFQEKTSEISIKANIGGCQLKDRFRTVTLAGNGSFEYLRAGVRDPFLKQGPSGI